MNNVLQWLQIVRLGLVQASIGAVVVFATSTLNRVMVVELALPALVPGALVGFHYAVQILRPRWGHGADLGGRRTPWIIGGMAALSAGAVLAALATAWIPIAHWPGLALAVLAYALLGVGVGASGTSLLLLLANQAGERRRAAAATVVWMMMIAGFIVTAAVAGHMLAPFSLERLVEAATTIAGAAFVITALAVWNIEQTRPASNRATTRAAQEPFMPALRDVWAEPEARRFTVFVFLSMLAYSAQELIFEPFAGAVFALSPAESAKLAGFQHTGLLGGMILVAIFGSAVSGPRLGSMRLWTIGGCSASGVAILALAACGIGGGTPAMLHAAVVSLGTANGAFSIAAVAAMMQLAGTGRPGREGVRMGLWGAAQALAFACGGVVGTGASDLSRHLFGSPALAYAAIFAGEAVLFCAAAVVAGRAFQQASRPSGTRTAPGSKHGSVPAADGRWAI